MPAPKPVTSVKCYNAQYAVILAGGLHPQDIKDNGWTKRQVFGFTKVPNCPITNWNWRVGGVGLHTCVKNYTGNGLPATSLSSSTSTITCTSSDPSIPAGCVSYEATTTATSQSGSNLKYYMHVAGCDDKAATCPA